MKRETKCLALSGPAGLALILLAAPAAHAEPIAPTATHDGVVGQVLVNPHGDTDGLVLKDGAVVRFPPHAVLAVGQLVAGTNVHVEGESLGPSGTVRLFDARVSTAGRVVVDPSLAPAPPRRPRPPGGPDGDLAAMTASGRVRLVLTNPDGVADGLVLEDGTVIHAGPRSRLARTGVVAGSVVNVSGVGGSYPGGRSLEARTLQLDSGPVYDLDRGPGRPAPQAPPAAPAAPPVP